MSRLPRYLCPRCGRRIAATTTSLYVTRREGKLIRYVYLRPHNDPQGQPCPGATATVEAPTSPRCSPNERTTP
jgi:hypothetical protein